MAKRVSHALCLLLVAAFALAKPSPLQFHLTREAAPAAAQLARRASQSGTVGVPLAEETESQSLYWFNLTIGTPEQHFSVQLDTGSSDLWVPSADSKTCKNHPALCAPSGSYKANESSTYQLLIPGGFYETYLTPSTDGGNFVSDTVRFGGITLPNTTFGVAINETGSPSASSNGILGMSYTALQTGDLLGFTYPTILDRLVTTGQILRHAFSLYLNDRANGKGSILFGGIDTERYTGDLIALPMIMDNYYGNQTVVEYRVAMTAVGINSDDGNYSALTTTSFAANAVLDSGTTVMQLPPDVANAIFVGLGATEISLGGELANVTSCSYKNSNTTIAVQFGGPSGPTVNVSLAEVLLDIGTYGDGDNACWIQIQAATSPLGYALGDGFLRSAYVVYDQDNNQIAIAQAKLDATTSNIQVIPAGTGLPGVSSTARGTAPEVSRSSAASGQASTSATELATGAGASSSTKSKSKVPTTLPMSAASPTFALGVTAPTTAAGASATAAGSASASGSASGAAGVLVKPVDGGVLALVASLALSVFAGMLML